MPNKVASPITLDVTFLIDPEESRKTRWRWLKGKGQLTLEGERVTLSGKRWRPFLRGKPQVVTFRRDQIRDVERAGTRIGCQVAIDEKHNEPLALEFANEARAMEVAAGWPTARSTESIELETFHRALDRMEVQVWVTPVLVAACALLFAATVASGVPLIAPKGPELIPWGTNYGLKTLHGEPWRLFTAMFLHFGLIHLALNCMALLSLGPLTEKLLGNFRFLMLYVTAGLCGSMLSLLWNPVVNSAGASGAIFGVMGALLAVMVNPRSRIPPQVAASHRKSGLLFIGYNVLIGLSHPGIDNAAHLGGLAGGFVLGWCLARPLPVDDQLPVRVSPWPAVLAGLVLLLGLDWSLSRSALMFKSRHAMELGLGDFAKAREAAIASEDELQQQLDMSKLTVAQWAVRVQGEVIPQWEKAVDAAELMPVASPRHEALRKEALDYATGQVLLTQLHMEAVRDGDQGKEDWADNVRARQGKRMKALRALMNEL